MDNGKPDRELVNLADGMGLLGYIRELWQRRHFSIIVPTNDIRAQNMDTVLGQIWHLLNPALLIAVYYLVFGQLLDADRGVDNFAAFLVVGIIFFSLTQRSIQDATVSIRRNQSLIRSIQFPRALLPIGAIVGQTIAFFPALVVTFGFLISLGVSPSFRWFLILPIIFLQQLFGLGAGFVFARLGYSFPDLQQLLPHFFRLLLYGSGIIFSLESFVTNQLVLDLYVINPLFDICTLARWALIGYPISGLCVLALVGWSIILPVFGLLYFRRQELRYGA